MSGRISSLFEGMTFYVYDSHRDTESLLRKHGAKVIPVNDMAAQTLIVAHAEGRRKPRLPEDEFGEEQWKVTSLWVEECIKSGSLLPVTDSEGIFIIGKVPQGASDPVLLKMRKEFTPAEDELLKKYAIEAANKGYHLDTEEPWQNITKQRKHPLSRFSAKELRGRYESYATASTPSQTSAKRAYRSSNKPAAESPAPVSASKRSRLMPQSDVNEPSGKKKSRATGTTKSKSPTATRSSPARAANPAETKSKPSVPVSRTGPAQPTTSGPAQRLLRAAQAVDGDDDERDDAGSDRAEGKYSLDEDEKMRAWAAEHPTLSQTEMWRLAVEQNLCPGRGVKSLKLHFRKLNERMNRTRPVLESRAKNFTPEEDHIMFRWIHHYRTVQGDRGMWGQGMWERAEQHCILPARTAEQMFNRFHNKLSKKLDEGMAQAQADLSELPWDALDATGNGVSGRTFPAAGPSVPAVSEAAVALLHFPRRSLHADGALERLQASFPHASLGDILRALFFTCGSESAAGRLLAGQEPDSKFDVWSTEEDRALGEGRDLDRPDVHRRRVFLGLEPRGGV